jgi:hypothetical protein
MAYSTTIREAFQGELACAQAGLFKEERYILGPRGPTSRSSSPPAATAVR